MSAAMSDQSRSGCLLTIVTVVFNDRLGLERTRNSILAQKYQDWEWIIIDGSSTDETLGALESLSGDLRVSIVSEADEGLYDAMNKGAVHANGAYINFLNAGDVYFDENSLLECMDQLIKRAPDILFAARSVTFQGDDRMRIGAKRNPRYIEHGIPTSHQSCLINANLQRAHHYDLRYKVSSDYNCLARMVHGGASVEYSDVSLVISDLGSNSVSYRNPIKVLIECARTQRDVFNMAYYKIMFSAFKRSIPMLYRRLFVLFPWMSGLYGRGGR